MRKFFGKKYLLNKLYDNGEGVRVRYPQRKKSRLWRSAGYCCPRYTRRGYKKNKQGIKADKSGFCHGGNRGNRWRVRKSSIFGSRENDVFEASKRCPFYFGQLLARAKNDRRDEDQAHSTRGAFIEFSRDTAAHNSCPIRICSGRAAEKESFDILQYSPE